MNLNIKHIILSTLVLLCLAACSKKQSPVPENGKDPGTNPVTPPVVTPITPVSFEVTELISAESEKVRLQHNWLATDFSATGLYVPPFSVVKVKVELLAGERAPVLLIGTYSRTQEHSSIPVIVPLKAGTNEFTAAGTGMIWIRYTDPAPIGKAKLTFTAGFKQAPYYITGKTTQAEWVEMLSKSTDVPDVIMEGERNILQVEKGEAFKYRNENIDALLKKLAEVVKIEDDYSGLDGLTARDKPNVHNKHLMVQHEDPDYYFFATNYRTAYEGKSISAILSLNKVTNDGWGVWHELGHQHQQTWTWSTITEATVNIYSRAVQRIFQPTVNRLVIDGVWAKVPAYLALPDATRDFNGANADVWLRLCMFQQLHLAFGDAFYQALHKKVRNDKPAFNGDASKMDYFMKAACQISGKNLSVFFKKWGLNVNSSVYTEIANLGLPAPIEDLTLKKD